MRKINKSILVFLLLLLMSIQTIFADTKDISLKINANEESLKKIETILNELEIDNIDMSTSEEIDEKNVVYTTITDNFILKTYLEDSNLKKMTITLGTTKEESTNTYIIYGDNEEKNLEPFISYVKNSELSKDIDTLTDKNNTQKNINILLIVLLVGSVIGLIVLFLVYSRTKEENNREIEDLKNNLEEKETNLNNEIVEHTKLKDIYEEQKDNLDELNKKVVENDVYINNVNRCVAKLNKELKEEKQLKESLIKNLETLHEKNLNTINKTHQEEITKINQNKEQEILNLKKSYDERISELEENNKGLQKIISKMS